MNGKNKICLWYENDAEAAANFYTSIFPDSKIIRIVHAPADYPGGREGDVITVEFSVFGV